VPYLARGPLALAFGLLLAGFGGYLAIASKEQYVPLAVPICATLVLASAARSRRGASRFLTARTAAAGAVSGLLALTALGYLSHDAASHFGKELHQEQAVDMIFGDIVNGHDNASADLRALGLPLSWASYAGDNFWSPHTVYHDPLFPRYADKLTDANVAHFLLTHPARLLTIGQLAASDALMLRVSYLGSYAPSAGHRAGALEHRVTVLESIMQAIPTSLGLLWLVPLWSAMAAAATWSLRSRRQPAWHRDCARTVLLLVGCAVAAFVPAAYFEGIETTRHMLAMNLSTALALVLSATLACTMIRRGLARRNEASGALADSDRRRARETVEAEL
jgi:hypothetical protein